MALGAGPAADAKVGVDILAATADTKSAIRELSKDIKKAQKEVEELLSKGLDITEKTAQLKKLEQQQKQLKEIDKNNRELEARSKRAIALGKLANATLTANAITSIARNGLDAQSVFTLASMAMNHEKAIEKAFGGKGLAFARRIAPAMPIIGAGVSSLMEGWGEFKKLREDFAAVGSDFRRGRITKEEELYALDIMTNTFEDPRLAQQRVRSAGEALAKIDPSKARKALEKFSFQETLVQYGGGMYGGSSTARIKTTKINADEFFKLAEENQAAAEKSQRGPLSQKQYEDVLVKTFTKMAGDRRFPQEMIEQFTKAIINGGFMPFEQELDHQTKWIVEDKQRQEIERHRVRFIPARLEY